jgi:hypothetical protein
MGLRQHQGNTAADGQGKIKKRALPESGPKQGDDRGPNCGNTSTATLRADRTTYDRYRQGVITSGGNRNPANAESVTEGATQRAVLINQA